MATETPHQRLDRLMNDRRNALRMRWRAVADTADISYETLRGVRIGKYARPDDFTMRGLEDALRWAPGSIDAVLAGDDPVPLESVQTSNAAVVTRLVGMVRAGVSFPAIIAEVQDKPPKEQVEILRRVANESAIPDVSNQDAR